MDWVEYLWIKILLEYYMKPILTDPSKTMLKQIERKKETWRKVLEKNLDYLEIRRKTI